MFFPLFYSKSDFFPHAIECSGRLLVSFDWTTRTPWFFVISQDEHNTGNILLPFFWHIYKKLIQIVYLEIITGNLCYIMRLATIFLLSNKNIFILWSKFYIEGYEFAHQCSVSVYATMQISVPNCLQIIE